jgi:hypothetical protein
MKLRFRKNSLRLRVNQEEAAMLASGEELVESVIFPGGAALGYVLASPPGAIKAAEFDGKIISVTAPLHDWVKSAEIGFYFEVEPSLKIAIEKDLECVDGPEDEKDLHAFRRTSKAC